MTDRRDGLAIETTQLRRRFGDFDAVAGVDLAVARGEIYGFLGPNGAGKSTTVKMLCTLLRPTGGTARVGGFDVVERSTDVRLRIGAALQDAAIDPKLTGREILALQGRYYGLSKADVATRVGEVLSLVDIGDAIDRRTGTYSGGMRRRLDLAAALVHNPEILFLDEPTTGLDPVSRARVWAEVRRLNDDLGMTIFLTTQYLEEADELADRVGIINDGVIVAEGTPDELKRRLGNDLIIARVADASSVEHPSDHAPDHALALEAALRARDVVSGVQGVDRVTVKGDELVVSVADGAAAISEVAVALSTCGVRVLYLTLRTPTLDDVFLELTGHRIEPGDEPAADAEEVPA